MKLRRIELLGFKSFRARTSLDISGGVTVVVGPNGCGKSNVVDAIRWTLGAQSAKDLRGRSMEDVIFAGSEQHKPAGFAEVTLTFDNSDGLATGTMRGVAEIAVTRRLFRTGESEYELNGSRARLRDIHELFLGTGVSSQEGYSIIEQGRVGFLVSARPEERRSLIEEAAGITRYKFQRKQAERKLEQSQENLTRLHDLLHEVRRQAASLERQAERARRWREASERLLVVRRALARAQLHERKRAYVEARERSRAEQDALDVARRTLQRAENDAAQSRVEAFSQERHLQGAQEAAHQAKRQLELAKKEMAHRRDLLDRLHGERQTLEETRVQVDQALEDAQATITRCEEREVLVAAGLRDAEEALARAEAALDGAATRVEALEEELRVSRHALARMEREQAGMEGRRAQAGADAIALRARLEALGRERAGWAAQAETFAAELRALEERSTRLQDSLDEAQGGLHAAREIERSALAAQERCKREAQAASLAHDAAEGRLKSAEGLLASGVGTSAGQRQVLEWAAKNDVAIWPLLDGVEPAAGAERALTALLVEEMATLIVPDAATAHRVMQAFPKQALRLRVASALGEHQQGSFWLARPGVPEVLVRSLVGATLVDAIDAVDSVGPVTRVTRSGERVDGAASVWARVGDEDGAAQERFRLARERDAWREKLAVASAALIASQAQRDLAEQHVEQALRARAEVQRRVEALREEFDQADQALRALRRRSEDVARRNQDLEQEAAQGDGRLQALDNVAAEVGAALAALAGEIRRVEGVVGVATEDLERQRELRALQGDARRVAESERRVWMDERAQVRATLQAARSALQRAHEERARLEARQVRLLQEVEGLTQREDLDEAKVAHAAAAAEAAEEALALRREGWESAQSALRGWDQHLGSLRRAAETCAERRQGAALIEERSALAFEQASRELEELGEGLGEDPAQQSGWDPDALRAEVGELEQVLRGLGQVNPLAESEHTEALARLEVLEQQHQDLVDASANLEEAIRRMDETCETLFRETYEAVRGKFAELFPRLFRGGLARLELTQPDNLLETGLEIIVQPPGKRVQTMTLLSGGEKALTAVALIFAVFQLKPAPFSVLDEVDAPLDEGNVGRFADLVHDMSTTSQFLVITHNKRTMEAADILYGVTMEEPGVSKVVGVRFQEG